MLLLATVFAFAIAGNANSIPVGHEKGRGEEVIQHAHVPTPSGLQYDSHSSQIVNVGGSLHSPSHLGSNNPQRHLPDTAPSLRNQHQQSSHIEAQPLHDFDLRNIDWEALDKMDWGQISLSDDAQTSQPLDPGEKPMPVIDEHDRKRQKGNLPRAKGGRPLLQLDPSSPTSAKRKAKQELQRKWYRNRLLPENERKPTRVYRKKSFRLPRAENKTSVTAVARVSTASQSHSSDRGSQSSHPSSLTLSKSGVGADHTVGSSTPSASTSASNDRKIRGRNPSSNDRLINPFQPEVRMMATDTNADQIKSTTGKKKRKWKSKSRKTMTLEQLN